jgi:hypothetical protein
MAAPGERDLDALLGALDVERRPGTFAYVSRSALDPAPGDTLATIDEGESITYVVPVETAPDDAVFHCAWLTLTVESSLEAVGLTAAFAAVLADAGIPANVLAGWHHDHILVPVERADDAMAALRSLASR